MDPVSFIDMVSLERNAKIILTDSEGAQKEAYFHAVPCMTMRDETASGETVDAGWNTLAGADSQRIVEAVQKAKPEQPIQEYGDGQAAQKILATLLCSCRF